MRVYTTPIQGFSVLCYRYRLSEGGYCKFHLLAEVGEPWQREAKALAQALADKHASKIVTKELDAYPWYVEVLELIKPRLSLPMLDGANLEYTPHEGALE